MNNLNMFSHISFLPAFRAAVLFVLCTPVIVTVQCFIRGWVAYHHRRLPGIFSAPG